MTARGTAAVEHIGHGLDRQAPIDYDAPLGAKGPARGLLTFIPRLLLP
jgi:hypothetical protein